MRKSQPEVFKLNYFVCFLKEMRIQKIPFQITDLQQKWTGSLIENQFRYIKNSFWQLRSRVDFTSTQEGSDVNNKSVTPSPSSDARSQ